MLGCTVVKGKCRRLQYSHHRNCPSFAVVLKAVLVTISTANRGLPEAKN